MLLALQGIIVTHQVKLYPQHSVLLATTVPLVLLTHVLKNQLVTVHVLPEVSVRWAHPFRFPAQWELTPPTCSILLRETVSHVIQVITVIAQVSPTQLVCVQLDIIVKMEAQQHFQQIHSMAIFAHKAIIVLQVHQLLCPVM